MGLERFEEDDPALMLRPGDERFLEPRTLHFELPLPLLLFQTPALAFLPLESPGAMDFQGEPDHGDHHVVQLRFEGSPVPVVLEDGVDPIGGGRQTEYAGSLVGRALGVPGLSLGGLGRVLRGRGRCLAPEVFPKTKADLLAENLKRGLVGPVGPSRDPEAALLEGHDECLVKETGTVNRPGPDGDVETLSVGDPSAARTGGSSSAGATATWSWSCRPGRSSRRGDSSSSSGSTRRSSRRRSSSKT